MERAFSWQLTRREAAALGAAAGAAALGASTASAARHGDGDVLRSLLRTERLIAFGYQHVLGIRLLSPGVAYLATSFLAQEQQHVAALSGQAARLGVAAPSRPSSVASADRELDGHDVSSRLADLHSQGGCVELLAQLEMVGEGAYFLALPKLTDPALQRIAAQIMATEAQHAAVWGGILHPGQIRKAIPDAFVEGRP